MAAALAFSSTYVVVALTGPWSAKRYLAHLGVVVLGVGLFFLVIFIMITSFAPSCPDPAPARALADRVGSSWAPQSCPG